MTRAIVQHTGRPQNPPAPSACLPSHSRARARQFFAFFFKLSFEKPTGTRVRKVKFHACLRDKGEVLEALLLWTTFWAVVRLSIHWTITGQSNRTQPLPVFLTDGARSVQHYHAGANRKSANRRWRWTKIDVRIWGRNKTGLLPFDRKNRATAGVDFVSFGSVLLFFPFSPPKPTPFSSGTHLI